MGYQDKDVKKCKNRLDELKRAEKSLWKTRTGKPYSDEEIVAMKKEKKDKEELMKLYARTKNGADSSGTDVAGADASSSREATRKVAKEALVKVRSEAIEKNLKNREETKKVKDLVKKEEDESRKRKRAEALHKASQARQATAEAKAEVSFFKQYGETFAKEELGVFVYERGGSTIKTHFIENKEVEAFHRRRNAQPEVILWKMYDDRNLSAEHMSRYCEYKQQQEEMRFFEKFCTERRSPNYLFEDDVLPGGMYTPETMDRLQRSWGGDWVTKHVGGMWRTIFGSPERPNVSSIMNFYEYTDEVSEVSEGSGPSLFNLGCPMVLAPGKFS